MAQNEVATRTDTRPAKPIATLRRLLEQALPQIKLALPKHMTPERMLRVALTAAQRNPELLECDQLSFVGCIVQASQLGLEPDSNLQLAHLVPFNNSKSGRKEVQLIPGYRGLIMLARRSGEVSSISAHMVHEKDEFTFVYGIDEKLEHKPFMGGDRGKPVCGYAVAKFKDGGYQFDVMSVSDIEKIREGAKSKNSPAWREHWDEMARKTVVRRLCKYLPLSPEMQHAIAIDERADAGLPQDLDIDISSEVAATATADRQAEMRERYNKPNGDAKSETPATSATEEVTDRPDQAQQPSAGDAPDPLQPLRTEISGLMDQLDEARGAGSADKAFDTVCGDTLAMDELEEPKLRELADFLRAAIKPAPTAEKKSERRTRPAGDRPLFGE